MTTECMLISLFFSPLRISVIELEIKIVPVMQPESQVTTGWLHSIT